MSTTLLDLNMLMALAWRDHVHYVSARRWFLAEAHKGWATCPFTQCGFLRLSSNPRITPLAGRPAEAMTVLNGLLSVAGHQFWSNNFSPADHAGFAKLQGHNQITDAYLLMLAQRHKGRLASFDAGIKTLAQEWLGDEKRVLLIPH